MNNISQINVLIVEDEQLAFEKLVIMLQKIDNNIKVVAHAKSISKAKEIINTTTDIDLAFFDIQLTDGISFSILEEVSNTFPIIFTTAYNEHAVRAFKHNSIDYLLKPIQLNELAFSLNKHHQQNDIKQNRIPSLINDLNLLPSKEYKSRFTVKVGEHIRIISIKDIACFYSFSKATFISTIDDRNYPIDYSLDSIEELLNPEKYFRVNRKFIINIDQIKDIISYTNSRLKLILNINTEEKIIISRERVKEFKAWIES